MDVDTFDFVRTRRWKKIVRGVIGVAISEGIYAFFNHLIPTSYKASFFTKYLIAHAMPHLLVPLLIYGPYISLCNMMHLVDVDLSDDEFEEDAGPKKTTSIVSQEQTTSISEVFADNQNGPRALNDSMSFDQSRSISNINMSHRVDDE